MDRRNFLKAGLLGTVTSGLPVAKAKAVENLSAHSWRTWDAL